MSDSVRRNDAAALMRVFGPAVPPVTAFKWALGHTIAAAGGDLHEQRAAWLQKTGRFGNDPPDDIKPFVATV